MSILNLLESWADWTVDEYDSVIANNTTLQLAGDSDSISLLGEQIDMSY